MIAGFWQTDYELKSPIRASGCALLSAMYIAPVSFSQGDVNEMYDALLGVGFIDKDCMILDWKSVLNSVSASMHFKFKCLEGYPCAAGEREIIKWWLSNVKENHFTVGDGKSRTQWDSMNRPDIMAKYATFVEKVIVTVG